MRLEQFLKEEGEGAATAGTTTGDIAKVPVGTKKSYKKREEEEE